MDANALGVLKTNQALAKTVRDAQIIKVVSQGVMQVPQKFLQQRY
jgi:hypothetical protein